MASDTLPFMSFLWRQFEKKKKRGKNEFLGVICSDCCCFCFVFVCCFFVFVFLDKANIPL